MLEVVGFKQYFGFAKVRPVGLNNICRFSAIIHLAPDTAGNRAVLLHYLK